MKFLLLALTCSLTLGFQPKDELDQFCNLLASTAGKDWTWHFEKANAEKNPPHPNLKAGTFAGTLTLEKNSESFELLIYRSTEHEVFPKQIQSYHGLASCFHTAQEGFSKGFICIDAAYVFLPMHPCWDKGYGEESKAAIARLNEQWKKK